MYLSQSMRKPFCYVDVDKFILIKVTNVWRHSRKLSLIARLH